MATVIGLIANNGRGRCRIAVQYRYIRRCCADDALHPPRQPRPSDSDVLTTDLMFDCQNACNGLRCLKPCISDSPDNGNFNSIICLITGPRKNNSFRLPIMCIMIFQQTSVSGDVLFGCQRLTALWLVPNWWWWNKTTYDDDWYKCQRKDEQGNWIGRNVQRRKL